MRGKLYITIAYFLEYLINRISGNVTGKAHGSEAQTDLQNNRNTIRFLLSVKSTFPATRVRSPDAVIIPKSTIDAPPITADGAVPKIVKQSKKIARHTGIY